MKLYWQDSDGVTRRYIVDGSPVSFEVGCPCPCACGFIAWIQAHPRRYGCTTTDRLTGAVHEGWPKLTVVVDRYEKTLVVTDNEIDQQSVYLGEVWR